MKTFLNLMNRKHFIKTAAVMLLSGSKLLAQSTSSKKKILIVYYSWSGNTRYIATQIKDMTGIDIFEIEPETAYPSVYKTVVDQAKKEINEGYKPPLKSKIDNIQQYDMILVGSPNWWSTVAPPVATFLSSHDFSGKTIAPFITHEGSRMGRSVSDIKKFCPKSNILEGLAIRGGSVKKAKEEIDKWLHTIDVPKTNA